MCGVGEAEGIKAVSGFEGADQYAVEVWEKYEIGKAEIMNSNVPCQRVETDHLLDEFIRCYCENQIPEIQVVGDETFIRIASPEFRYVEWVEWKEDGYDAV